MQSQTPKEIRDIDFAQIKVKPIAESEKHRFKTLMSEFHYLGCPAMVGETLQYVATYWNKWAALLIFSSAALKAGERDRWIGWQACFQWQRAH
ncbi:MAG: DUF4338 domain-containing protein [Proteobacteria bacterium]|nr:DUF4338 domain-containing protein [Pseudomonadota bacterium]